jgi:predicted RNase H-like HicB family nuclease
MEKIINIHVEKLPEGVYLATPDDIQGLVAQGRMIWEILEIARDVARKLLEAQGEEQRLTKLFSASERFDYPLVLEV